MTDGGGSREKYPQLKSFLSGGIGGICLVFVGQPFDLIKVRLQAHVAERGVKPPGAAAVLRQTLAKEGVRGLYRGMAAPLYGVTPIFALCFWAFELGKSSLRAWTGLRPGEPLPMWQIGLAGAFSAVPTTAIMAPGERIKVVLQTQTAFKGPGDVVRHIVKTDGVLSLFRGSAATLMRDGVGSVAYFTVYEAFKRQLLAEGQTTMSPAGVIFGGGFAGVCNWLVALPFDVIKSRIQASTVAGERSSILGVGRYAVRRRGVVCVCVRGGRGRGLGGVQVLVEKHSQLDTPRLFFRRPTLRKIIAEEGIGALYRGVSPALLRAFPANAGASALSLSLSLPPSLPLS